LTGAIIGAMLPLLIKWLGGDPALMSAPLIATLSDVFGIVIFFTIVKQFFF
jgi:magnesium transporter